MEKILKENKTLPSLSHNVSFETNTDSKHHHLIRRKCNGVNNGICNIEKRNKSKMEHEMTKIFRYIPINKADLSGKSISFRIQRQRGVQNLQNNKDSFNFRRFQRNASSEGLNPNFLLEQIIPKECKIKRCIQDKNNMKETIEHFKRKNERLEQEKQSLIEQLTESEEKIRQLQEKLSQKTLKDQQMKKILIKRQTACNRMHQTINQKYRQISKLEDIISKLQKQIMSSNNPQSFTPLSLQSSRIINQLTSKLKYKQIENHLLKKQKFDISALQEQLKVLNKENCLLKDRLQYYIRLSNRNQKDSCSSQSISLDLSELSPLKKKSSSQISSNSKIPPL